MVLAALLLVLFTVLASAGAYFLARSYRGPTFAALAALFTFLALTALFAGFTWWLWPQMAGMH